MYNKIMASNNSQTGGKTMAKINYIVMKSGEEISRQKTKKMADCIAKEIGGYVVKYTKE
jgi:hypothetical protein